MSEFAILIPVLGRPERATSLVESIRSSTTVSYRLLFICSPNDRSGRAAYGRFEHIVVEWEPGRADFAKKINRGYAETTEPFLFLGATDLTFTPGWAEAVLRVAKETGAGVIGTWDGANPTVMNGKHSTHPVVRRSYIEEMGGTVDDTGTIYCEQYDHQAVDNELIEVAQMRSQWAFAADARVLHHHPLYDRSQPMDETYSKALARSREDKMLFMRRRRMWQRELRLQDRQRIRGGRG